MYLLLSLLSFIFMRESAAKEAPLAYVIKDHSTAKLWANQGTMLDDLCGGEGREGSIKLLKSWNNKFNSTEEEEEEDAQEKTLITGCGCWIIRHKSNAYIKGRPLALLFTFTQVFLSFRLGYFLWYGGGQRDGRNMTVPPYPSSSLYQQFYFEIHLLLPGSLDYCWSGVDDDGQLQFRVWISSSRN